MPTRSAALTDTARAKLLPEITAVLAAMGKAQPIGKSRGRVFPLPGGARAFITVHPSSLLRIPDHDDRHKAYADFVRDFKQVQAEMMLKLAG